MTSIIEAIQKFFITTATIVSTTVSAAIPINNQAIQLTQPEINTYTATNSANTPIEKLNAFGSYSYLNQTITYNITFPKNGGAIDGNFEGPCAGTITGTYDADTQSVNGKLNGKCKIAFIEQEISGHYSGQVNTVQKKVNIDWVNDGLYGPKQGTIDLQMTESN